MYAMQYEITLPADYDMKIIRHRVATRGHRTDGFPGLGLKAYLIRERGVDGSPVNQYAPFYLWHDTDGMSRFLVGGGGFQGIIDDFGRPPVRHWTGIACEPGPARAAMPRSASRDVTPLPATIDLEPLIEELHEQAQHEEVHTAALAFDPHDWQLIRFILWADTAPGRYEVLHLSTPHLAEIRQRPR